MSTKIDTGGAPGSMFEGGLDGTEDDVEVGGNQGLPPVQDQQPSGDEPDGEESDEPGEGEETAGEEKPKKNKIPREQRIRELTAKLRETERSREQESEEWKSRLDNIEKLLRGEKPDGNIPDDRDTAPDPTNLEKYRLGDLDSAYIRDLARWEIQQEFKTLHQRQVEREAQAEQQRHASEVLGRVSDIADKGTTLHPDYVETVVAPFMRGELPLEEHTFEAAAETEYGAEILRELALNPTEAVRVASLTPIKQVMYVAERARFFSENGKPRLPRAGAPPTNAPRGTSGRYETRPDTDSLDDYEKLRNGARRG